MSMPSLISFSQSQNIFKYKPLLHGLTDVFGEEHYSTILTWCGIMDEDEEDIGKYWQLWLIEAEEGVIGMCGLYSENLYNNSELWLGWFGLLPEYRKFGIGSVALKFMEMEAKKAGCKKMLSYIDNGEQPLGFYQKNGYEIIYSNDPFIKDNNYILIQKQIDLKKQNILL